MYTKCTRTHTGWPLVPAGVWFCHDNLVHNKLPTPPFVRSTKGAEMVELPDHFRFRSTSQWELSARRVSRRPPLLQTSPHVQWQVRQRRTRPEFGLCHPINWHPLENTAGVWGTWPHFKPWGSGSTWHVRLCFLYFYFFVVVLVFSRRSCVNKPHWTNEWLARIITHLFLDYINNIHIASEITGQQILYRSDQHSCSVTQISTGSLLLFCRTITQCSFE